MKYLLDTDICIYWLKGKDRINQVGRTEIAICDGFRTLLWSL